LIEIIARDISVSLQIGRDMSPTSLLNYTPMQMTILNLTYLP